MTNVPGPHLLTTEMLQTLLAARDRPPQTSYPKLQDPEPYEGEKAKFKTFLAQCELKFRTEGNPFDDDAKKTGYASSLLRGVAWNWVETFLNQEGGINLTWEELKTNIKHAFGQVDAEEIAFEKFHKIQQGNRTAATYWAEFQRIKANLPYADNVCIARFRDRLHPEVKRHLVMSEVPATVQVDYATAAIKTDSRLCNLGVISRRPAASPEARFHVHTKEPQSAPRETRWTSMPRNNSNSQEERRTDSHDEQSQENVTTAGKKDISQKNAPAQERTSSMEKTI